MDGGLRNINYGIAEREEDPLGLPDLIIQIDNEVVHKSFSTPVLNWSYDKVGNENKGRGTLCSRICSCKFIASNYKA